MKSPSLVITFLALVGLGIGACSSDDGPAAPDPVKLPLRSLRSLATDRGFIIGAFDEGFASTFDPPRFPLQQNAQYRALFSQEFNAVTINVGMAALRPSPTETSDAAFAYVDSVVAFAQEQGMKVFFHHLIWREENPAWLDDEPCDATILGDILESHITDVVTRYRGKIFAYSVVNEPFDEDRGSQIWSDPWGACVGVGYIERAFRAARAADPDAILYLNEFNAESTTGEPKHIAKSNAVFDVVAGLMAMDNPPIDAVGLQMHLDLGGRVFRSPPSPDGVRQNINRLGGLGLDVYITEMDVAIFNASGSMSEKLQAQAVVYGRTAELCLSISVCKGLIVWGLTDEYSWVYELARQLHGYEATPPDEAPLLFDTQFRPKPAYDSVRSALGR